MAVSSCTWLAQAHHHVHCSPQAPPPPRPTVCPLGRGHTCRPPVVQTCRTLLYTSVHCCTPPCVHRSFVLRPHDLRTPNGPYTCRTVWATGPLPSIRGSLGLWSLPSIRGSIRGSIGSSPSYTVGYPAWTDRTAANQPYTGRTARTERACRTPLSIFLNRFIIGCPWSIFSITVNNESDMASPR